MANKKQYPIKRSIYSGKIVNGKEVILVDEVFDYVSSVIDISHLVNYLKSLQYKIVPPPKSNRLWIDRE